MAEGGLLETDLLLLDEVSRYEAFLDLYRSGDPAVRAALRGLLAGPNPLVKIALLEYLQEVPERRAVRLVVSRLEDPNPEVRRAAAAAYKRSQLNGKNRLLRPLLASPSLEARRFAIRTLARVGDRDILAALLRDLPSAPETVQEEILAALRALAEPSALGALLGFSSSPKERLRHQALLALAELRARGEPIPADAFLERLRDPSDRVRRTALSALRYYPSRRITRLFLDQALDAEEDRQSRRRAIESLSAFPDAEWVRPLVGLVAESADRELSLAAEITLKRFPPALLKAGLLALAAGEPGPLSRQAALLAAETLGEDPEVRALIMGLWETRPGLEDRLVLLDALRDLDDPSVIPLLLSSLKESPVLAYGAIAALNRLWTADSGPRMLGILKDPSLPQQARQALLSGLAKRGPSPSIRAELLPWLLGPGLSDPVLNIRYLSLQTLAWYPLKDKLAALLGELASRESVEMADAARRQLAAGLRNNPLPLALAWRDHPRRRALTAPVAAVLSGRPWDPHKAAAALESLARDPDGMASESPFEFLALGLKFVERGDMGFPAFWGLLRGEEQKRQALALCEAALRDPSRSFPPPPLELLGSELAALAPAARTAVYELAELSREPAAPARLCAWLLRETDAAALARGREALARLVWRARA